MSSTPQHYIVAIDGLRAIAVGLVVLFHAGFAGFDGGFVGVDVFFVISGFLITANIVRDLEAGRFSFAEFFKRRVARLFPALFVVILLTLVAALFVLSPGDLARLGQSSMYASLSTSNIFFWFEAGYFDRASEAKALLHTWSLAVEEQFYLVWPLLLAGLYALRTRQANIIGMIVVSAASLIAAWILAAEHPDAVFYLMPFRAYQFGFGALIALMPVVALRTGTLAGIIALAASLGLVVLSAQIDGTSHIALSAVAPAALAALVICFVSSPLVQGVLANPVMVWIGKRSYSIYLVHWPLMVLWKLGTDYSFSPAEQVASVVLSIVLGAVLHSLVESRFRFSKATPATVQYQRTIGTVAFMLIPIVLAAHVWGSGGYPQRIPAELEAIAKSIGAKWKERTALLRDGQCNLVFSKYEATDYDWETCYNAQSDKPTWLILGDSHGSGAYVIFQRSYPEIQFNQMTIPGCRLRPAKESTGSKMCNTLIDELFARLPDSEHIQGVVISSKWLKGRLYEVGVVIQELKAAGKPVVLVNQRQRFNASIPDLLLTSMGKTQAAARAQHVINEVARENADTLYERLKDKAPIVDMLEIQCPEGFCDIFDTEGKLLYLDNNHFSAEGFTFIASRMRQQYPDLLTAGTDTFPLGR